MGKTSSRFLLPTYFSHPQELHSDLTGSRCCFRFSSTSPDKWKQKCNVFRLVALTPRPKESFFTCQECVVAHQDAKLESSLGQLPWYAPRKHLSLHVGLDFPSLARWFFPTLRQSQVWRQNELWWDSNKMSWQRVCIPTCPLCPCVASSQAKEEGFNPGDKACP